MDDHTVVLGLLDGGWRDLIFEPFRDGIEICPLNTGEPEQRTQAAVLRYAPGASVPTHMHTGAEVIVVLEGEQIDERGRYPAGSVLINHPGSSHSVHAPVGCVVLITWASPISFADTRPGGAH